MRQEIEHLGKAFNPNKPFLFVLGGAKFETKMPLITKFINKADKIFLAGALANNIFKERGLELGTSLVSEVTADLRGISNSDKVVTPVDITVTNSKGEVINRKPNELQKDECIVDVGHDTVKQLEALVANSKTILWNGPLGNYELGFQDKTEVLAKMVADKTLGDVESIVGGGDTIASINRLGLNDKFTFISTGGGAMLDYLVNETLPGLEVLK
jgi:phosphoglycerate kinase